ncbi:MAG TPA: hypothetical protein VJN94_15965 [Candidatus Binataceae bacterium]|nr:hypothetical protein [Candidatus Binataceae bacterium]
MLNSTILDVAIGLIFTFLAVSLAVSSIVEAIASALKWRSATLLQGVKDLLNDSNFTGLARDLYNHALVNPRDPGTARTADDMKNKPAYINAQQFADAMIDLTQIANAAPGQIKQAINANVADPQLNSLLTGMVDRTGGTIHQMRQELAGWFDNAMDRVGGAYKRRTQVWSFFIALVMAALLNVSAINVGRAMWQQPMLARTVAPQAKLDAKSALHQLELLGALDVAIGWSQKEVDEFFTSWNWFDFIAGWLITAVATLFGAPFWFDSLQQIIRLKGSGPSPAEKSSSTGAAA